MSTLRAQTDAQVVLEAMTRFVSMLQQALASDRVRKARLFPISWVSGWSQALWAQLSAEEGPATCETFAKRVALALGRCWDAAKLQVEADLFAHGLRDTDVTFIPADDGWTDVLTSSNWLHVIEGPERDEVVARLTKTLTSADVKSVCRIEQPELRQRFQQVKASLERRGPPGANEQVVWHGSGRTRPSEIISDEVGFDPRFSDSGMWGRAAYFAEDARYSNEYAHVLDASGERRLRQIFLVQLAAGRAEERKSNNRIRRPARGFDSVTGVTGGTRVFMVYDADTRALPTHLVTYELRPRGSRSS